MVDSTLMPPDDDSEPLRVDPDAKIYGTGVTPRAELIMLEDVKQGEYLALDNDASMVRRFRDDEPLLAVADRDYEAGETIRLDFYTL